MTRHLQIVCILALLTAAAAPASAYGVRVFSGEPVRWESDTIQYYFQDAGSDDLTPIQSRLTFERAIESWNELECSSLVFEEIGDAPNPALSLLGGGGPNGLNEIVWIEDNSWTYGQWVLGVTAPLIVGTGLISEADIAFNGLQQSWSNDGGFGMDVESVAVHELGHMFGLQHNLGPYNNNDLPTMHPSVLPNLQSRSLTADDIEGACYLYPASGEFNCASDDDCPNIVGTTTGGDEFHTGIVHCDSGPGTCSVVEFFPAGIAQLGEICEQDANCVEGLQCQPWLDTAVCSGYCRVKNSKCPEDFDCVPFDSVPQWGACLPSDGIPKEPGSGPGGCVNSTACLGGKVCLPTPEGDTKLCTDVCEVADEASCGAGKGCWSYGNPNGGCFDLALFPADEPEVVPDAAPDAGPEPVPDAAPESAPDAAPPVEAEADAGPDAAIEADAGGDAAGDLSVSADTGVNGATGSGGCQSGGSGAPLSLVVALMLGWAVVRRRLLHT